MLHVRLTRFMFLLLLCIFLLSGCKSDRGAESRTWQDGIRTGGKLTVVTSFYPIYIETINVTRDIQGVQVINMTKPQTGCLHDYQLRPEDLKMLEKADIFVVNGGGMESFLDKVMSQQPGLKVVEASKGIELIRNVDGSENPHVWVSVSNAIIQVGNIAEQLSEIDAVNAKKYRSNAEEYIKKLEALRDKMHRVLDGLSNRSIITFHEAFPYFAREFNLSIAAVIEREPGSEPSPKDLEETVKIIKESNIKALFAEPQYSSKAAETIARETGARIFILDPAVTGEAKPDAYDDYINIMEQNLKVLSEALK